MKLTWVGPYKPVPDRSGADLRSYYLMRELKRRGASIEGYFLGSHGDDCDKFLDDSTVLNQNSAGSILRAGWRRMSGEPLTVGRFYHPRLESLIADRDLTYVDHLHMVPNVQQQPAGSYWLDEHNLEYELWDQYGSVCGAIKSPFIKWEAKSIRSFERRAIERSGGTGLPLDVSHTDLSDNTADNVTVVPNGVPGDWLEDGRKRMEHPVSSVNRIGFIGKFDWFPNRLGVKRFLQTVWRPIHRAYPDLTLALAGKSPPSGWKKYDGVELKGYVESKQDFLESLDAMVIPLELGSGTRLKALEAAARGIPLLSTSKGVEGLEFESIPTANSIPQLNQSIRELIQDPSGWSDHRKALYKRVSNHYRWRNIGETLWTALDDLL